MQLSSWSFASDLLMFTSCSNSFEAVCGMVLLENQAIMSVFLLLGLVLGCLFLWFGWYIALSIKMTDSWYFRTFSSKELPRSHCIPVTVIITGAGNILWSKNYFTLRNNPANSGTSDIDGYVEAARTITQLPKLFRVWFQLTHVSFI